MDEWQKDIINRKIEACNMNLFSLEIDARVASRMGDKETLAQVASLMRRAEEQKAILQEVLNGTVA